MFATIRKAILTTIMSILVGNVNASPLPDRDPYATMKVAQELANCAVAMEISQQMNGITVEETVRLREAQTWFEQESIRWSSSEVMFFNKHYESQKISEVYNITHDFSKIYRFYQQKCNFLINHTEARYLFWVDIAHNVGYSNKLY